MVQDTRGVAEEHGGRARVVVLVAWLLVARPLYGLGARAPGFVVKTLTGKAVRDKEGIPPAGS